MQQRPASLRPREERQPRSGVSTGSMSAREPSPPSIPPQSENTMPPSGTPKRPQTGREEGRRQLVQTFPSDEEFSKMSRKDRIALMEREAGGNQDQADFKESSRGRLAQSQP